MMVTIIGSNNKLLLNKNVNVSRVITSNRLFFLSACERWCYTPPLSMAFKVKAQHPYWHYFYTQGQRPAPTLAVFLHLSSE